MKLLSKFKLFQNDVGRPSNDVKRKRKIVLTAIIVGCIAIVGSTGYLTYSTVFNGELTTDVISYNSAPGCNMPYTQSKCKTESKSTKTIKKIKQFLCKTGHFPCLNPNSSLELGAFLKKFTPSLTNAVKKFQSENGLFVDGSIGPETLEKIVLKAQNPNRTYTTGIFKKKTKQVSGATTTYYKLIYNRNGGSGPAHLNSTWTDSKGREAQVMLSGIKTAISDTELTRSGYKHVGWISSYKNKRYDLGQQISATGFANGQEVTMTAAWCANSNYNSSKKTCSKVETDIATNVSGTKVISNGYMTSYGPDCSGKVTAKTACGISVTKDKVYKYNDSSYGEVRIVASNYLKSKYGCGSIIKIVSSSNKVLKTEAGNTNYIIAVVADTGTDGKGNPLPNNQIDFMTKSEYYANNTLLTQDGIDVYLIRKGW